MENSYIKVNGPVWSWFTEPQAVYDPVTESLYIGVHNHNRPAVLIIDCATLNHTLVPLGNVPAILELDDHNNPSVRIMSNGHILVVYCKHNTDDFWNYQVSVRPNDATEFGPPQVIPLVDGATYTHTWEINGKVYNMTRAATTNRTWVVQEADVGVGPTLNWSAPIASWQGVGNGNNPDTFGYLVSSQTTPDRVDFLVTDDHPVFEADRVGHFYHDGFTFRNTDGTALPDDFDFDDVQLVSSVTLPDRMWVTDVKLDDAGNPRALYMKYRGATGTNQEVWHAQWDGSAWVERLITDDQGSGWLPPERFYNGEAHFDPDDLDALIHSVERDGVYEVEHWRWDGVRFAKGSFTRNSTSNQLRPRFITTDGTKQKFAYWISPESYVDFDNYISRIVINRSEVQ